MRKYERFVYEITFENKNSEAIENVTVQYCIFYEREENNSSTRKVDTQIKVVAGSFDVARIASREKQTKTTNSVVLEQYSYNITDYYRSDGYDPESTSDKLKGIWIRLSVKTASGQTIERNVFNPSSIEGKYSWKDSSLKQKKKRKKKR